MTARAALASSTRRAKRGTRRALQAVGLEVHRVRRPRAGASDHPVESPFYNITPTCQIADLAFLYETYFGRRDHGRFVEVGAFDGISFSNTSGLIAAGWSGWLIEPVPSSFAACRDRYRTRPDVVVDQMAISDHRGELDIVEGGALSTADAVTLDEYRTIDWAKGQFDEDAPTSVQVPCLPLDDYLVERGIDAGFDLLVVDVEGHESAVFAGFDLARWRPVMLIVEIADNHPDLHAGRDAEAELLLAIVAAGYTIVAKDAINTVFVDTERYRAALRPP